MNGEESILPDSGFDDIAFLSGVIDTERTAVAGKDAYKVTIYQPYENQIVIVDAQTGEVLSESVEDANRG